jgi:hypothetical protein
MLTYTYLIMIGGFAILLAMLYTGLPHATPAQFLRRGILLAAVWFTLCLVVQ